MGNTNNTKLLSSEDYRKIWDKSVGSTTLNINQAINFLKQLVKLVGIEGFMVSQLNSVPDLFAMVDETSSGQLSPSDFKLVVLFLCKSYRIEGLLGANFLQDTILVNDNFVTNFKNYIFQPINSKIFGLMEKIWTIEYPSIHEIPPPNSPEWAKVGFLIPDRPANDFTDTGFIGISCFTALIEQHDFYHFLKHAMLEHKMVFVSGVNHILHILFKTMGWNLSAIHRLPSGSPMTYRRVSEFLFKENPTDLKFPEDATSILGRINRLFFLLLGLLLKIWHKNTPYKDWNDLYEQIRVAFEEMMKQFLNCIEVDVHLFDNFGIILSTDYFPTNPFVDKIPKLFVWRPVSLEIFALSPKSNILDELKKFLLTQNQKIENFDVYAYPHGDVVSQQDLDCLFDSFLHRNLWLFPKSVLPERAGSIKVCKPTQDLVKNYIAKNLNSSSKGMDPDMAKSPRKGAKTPMTQKKRKTLSDNRSKSSPKIKDKDKLKSNIATPRTLPAQTPRSATAQPQTSRLTPLSNPITSGKAFTILLEGDDKKSIIFSPDKLLYDVLEGVCIARGIKIEDYEVRNAKDDSLINWNKQTKLPVLNTMTIKFLKRTAPAPPKEEPQQQQQQTQTQQRQQQQQNPQLTTKIAAPIGNLTVFIKEGKTLLVADAFGKCFPLVRITFEGPPEVVWTSTKERGVFPKWLDTFTTPFNQRPIKFLMEVISVDGKNEEFIGRKEFIYNGHESINVEPYWLSIEGLDPSERIKRGEILIGYSIKFTETISNAERPPQKPVLERSGTDEPSATKVVDMAVEHKRTRSTSQEPHQVQKLAQKSPSAAANPLVKQDSAKRTPSIVANRRVNRAPTPESSLQVQKTYSQDNMSPYTPYRPRTSPQELSPVSSPVLKRNEEEATKLEEVDEDNLTVELDNIYLDEQELMTALKLTVGITDVKTTRVFHDTKSAQIVLHSEEDVKTMLSCSPLQLAGRQVQIKQYAGDVDFRFVADSVKKKDSEKSVFHSTLEDETLRQLEAENRRKQYEIEMLRKQQLETERVRQQLEIERIRQQQIEAERMRQQQIEFEKLRQQRIEAERIRQQQLEIELLHQRQLEAERRRIEAERLRQQQLETERMRKQQMETERIRQQIEMERMEAERLRKQQEAEKFRLQQMEAERIRQQKEAEMIRLQHIEAERIRQEIENERLKQKIENDRLESMRNRKQKDRNPIADVDPEELLMQLEGGSIFLPSINDVQQELSRQEQQLQQSMGQQQQQSQTAIQKILEGQKKAKREQNQRLVEDQIEKHLEEAILSDNTISKSDPSKRKKKISHGKADRHVALRSHGGNGTPPSPLVQASSNPQFNVAQEAPPFMKSKATSDQSLVSSAPQSLKTNQKSLIDENIQQQQEQLEQQMQQLNQKQRKIQENNEAVNRITTTSEEDKELIRLLSTNQPTLTPEVSQQIRVKVQKLHKSLTSLMVLTKELPMTGTNKLHFHLQDVKNSMTELSAFHKYHGEIRTFLVFCNQVTIDTKDLILSFGLQDYETKKVAFSGKLRSYKELYLKMLHTFPQ